MDHDILREKLLKAMGGKVPIPLRDRWSEFVRNRSTRIVVRYEWIKDRRFYEWIRSQPELDMEDGTECIGVFICPTR